jgi:DNA mismatch endonuclease (patch repair protein)
MSETHDVYDAAKRSEVMRRVKSKNTKPEIKVRSLLHRAGYRFRLHRKDLPGTPDLVFPGRKKVIFVHGCFWHQHPGCKYASRPGSRVEYWNPKLDRNMVRDSERISALEYLGWTPFVVWECELKDVDSLMAKLRRFLDDEAEAPADAEPPDQADDSPEPGGTLYR